MVGWHLVSVMSLCSGPAEEMEDRNILSSFVSSSVIIRQFAWGGTKETRGAGWTAHEELLNWRRPRQCTSLIPCSRKCHNGSPHCLCVCVCAGWGAASVQWREPLTAHAESEVWQGKYVCGLEVLSLVVTCCSKSSLVDDCIFSGISCCRERWCVFLLLW